MVRRVWVCRELPESPIYPLREPEAQPATVFYSVEGERKELSVSPRSSHGARPLPTPAAEQTRSGLVSTALQFQPPGEAMLPKSPVLKDTTWTSRVPGPSLPDPLHGGPPATPQAILERASRNLVFGPYSLTHRLLRERLPIQGENDYPRIISSHKKASIYLHIAGYKPAGLRRDGGNHVHFALRDSPMCQGYILLCRLSTMHGVISMFAFARQSRNIPDIIIMIRPGGTCHIVR
ncbi:hypothetical protein R3P38DRAFT_2800563 [Favolaschia claudopus]|uniref:Uncharacterized protein n=1 Tax=Favolaschia claudopus TaxID=2862362 RepID=A0AAV9ZXH4_9AGAR